MSNDQPVSVLVKEGFGRRAVLQALMAGAGATVAAPALAMSHDHPMHETLQSPAKVGTADRRASAPGYKPQLLDKHVFGTLIVLSEAIVPGSTKAKVAEFIDALLAVENPATQRRFFTAIGAMEGLAIAEHRKAWKSLTAAEQTALLTKASTAAPQIPPASGIPGAAPAAGRPAPGIRDQFEHLKGWISGAYYSTEIGMRELGWNGTVFFAQLPECGPTTRTAP
jgi:hypothetical protein